MKRKKGFGEKISELFDIPQEVLSGMPKLTISGDSCVLIENHKGLLEYGREIVRVDGGRVQVIIRGNLLELESVGGAEMLITGQIFSADIE